MSGYDWVKEFPGAVTVCDTEGRILEMNEQVASRSSRPTAGPPLIGNERPRLPPRAEPDEARRR